MASYRTEEQINVDAEIELDITVQDQDGNEIDCDIEGYGFELTAQIDTQYIKDNLLDEVKEKARDELEDVFKDNLISNMANADSPMRALSGMISVIADHHDRLIENTCATMAKLNERLKEQAQEIQDLKCSVASKEVAIGSQNQAIQNLQVKLDDRNKTNKKLRDGLMEYERLSDEKRLAEEAAQGGPLSIIEEHNTLEEAREAASRQSFIDKTDVVVEDESNNPKENK